MLSRIKKSRNPNHLTKISSLGQPKLQQSNETGEFIQALTKYEKEILNKLDKHKI